MLKKRRILPGLIIAIILILSSSTSAFAVFSYEPKFNNTITANSVASISDGGLLTITNKYQGIKGTTTKGEITTYVEKKTMGFFWTRVDIGQPDNQWHDVILSGVCNILFICAVQTICFLSWQRKHRGMEGRY